MPPATARAMPLPHFNTPASPIRSGLASLWLMGSLTLLGACHATPPAAAPGQPVRASAVAGTPAQALMAQIQAEIGDARCEQDSQCRSLPTGHKACGGPAGHLAWSTVVSQESRLQALALQHQQASKAQEKPGMVSDCMVVGDPGARCNAQTRRCELNPRGRGGLSAM